MFPIPSFTAVMIVSAGIPEIRPIASAPTRIAIIAWILNLIISTSRIARPTMAATTSLVGFKSSVSVPINFSSLSLFAFYPCLSSDVSLLFLLFISNSSDVLCFMVKIYIFSEKESIHQTYSIFFSLYSTKKEGDFPYFAPSFCLFLLPILFLLFLFHLTYQFLSVISQMHDHRTSCTN